MDSGRVNVNKLIILGTKTVICHIVFIVFFFAIPVYKEAKQVFGSVIKVYSERLILGEKALIIDIADDPEERTKGLSGRRSLAEGEGLLFVFDQPDFYGMWMKDMNFSIDIIWLDSTKEVVSIVEYVSPDTFPKVFKPTRAALYVLEVNAGFVEKYGIKIGDQATSL